jgi:hypothetical protein
MACSADRGGEEARSGSGSQPVSKAAKYVPYNCIDKRPCGLPKVMCSGLTGGGPRDRASRRHWLGPLEFEDVE